MNLSVERNYKKSSFWHDGKFHLINFTRKLSLLRNWSLFD
ncbi:CLUMA_CG005278, isoform A [Clunio marinus]|uniref:CLUMA_CG005278, isoform A n=1 Tax=Clunio marinus TaxID=568069 RepID=A0A1J1HU75_9DIPT|nr:CLUMA_CG005278, isoform A [Clunio marinus]